MKKNLVLLPGYDGDGVKAFRKLSSLLSARYRILTISYPILKETDRSYSLEELVEIIDVKVKKGKILKFDLAGFSLGGFIATTYAQRHPDKIRSLTLISSSIYPLVSPSYKVMMWLAHYLFAWPQFAWLFTRFFLSPKTASLTENFPVPKPGPDFPIKRGYPVFGTLTKVLFDTNKHKFKVNNENYQKKAILFEDDLSFPAKIYKPLLNKNGFEIKIYKTGGHAVSEDYWKKVAECF